MKLEVLVLHFLLPSEKWPGAKDLTRIFNTIWFINPFLLLSTDIAYETTILRTGVLGEKIHTKKTSKKIQKKKKVFIPIPIPFYIQNGIRIHTGCIVIIPTEWIVDHIPKCPGLMDDPTIFNSDILGQSHNIWTSMVEGGKLVNGQRHENKVSSIILFYSPGSYSLWQVW